MVTKAFLRYIKRQEIKEKMRLEEETKERKGKEKKRISKIEKRSAGRLERWLEDLKILRKMREESRALRILENKERKEKKCLEREIEEPEISEEFKRSRVENKDRYKPREKTEFTKEEKEKCKKKTIDELAEEIGGSILVCPTGNNPKKAISQRELTADLICFRKRIRRKSPERIRAAYDKLLSSEQKN
jgi:hypothetical protein